MNKLPHINSYIFRALLLSATLIGIVSCQKELSFESGGGGAAGGSAVFSLVPSGSNCSDAAVSGNFIAGTPTTSNEMVIVTVNVTKIGNWTYSTSQVNGFSFTGNGDFTATGNQSITLYAAGKPTAAGDFNFSLNIGGTNCKFVVTVLTAGGGGAGDIYYKATIGGVNYYQAVTASNNYEAGSGLGGVDDVAFGSGINYSNPPIPKGLTEMSAGKGMFHHYTTATQAQFKAFFAPGDYPYAPTNFSTDGVSITWTDPNGEYWDTRNGSVDQSGSTFKIISVEDAPDITGTFYVKVKMQFTCKLYNVNSGAMKQLTNGEMVVYFGMI